MQTAPATLLLSINSCCYRCHIPSPLERGSEPGNWNLQVVESILRFKTAWCHAMRGTLDFAGALCEDLVQGNRGGKVGGRGGTRIGAAGTERRTRQRRLNGRVRGGAVRLRAIAASASPHTGGSAAPRSAALR
ncbi:hypothetical protein K1T71_001888 [Dendrolimus kikuchii]|uniref:Uncharacterized protein n=1 Tax=Dendrolimus kikuchii TaxID=765133 RepID=A0ACC1DEZ5_9NEOP|nr:hypothetical protein K1T71_001888 [Dendrolimus kikuchii]